MQKCRTCIHCTFRVSIPEILTTHLLHIKLENLLHVGGQTGEEHVEPPVVGYVAGHDGPDCRAGRDLTPRRPTVALEGGERKQYGTC